MAEKLNQYMEWEVRNNWLQGKSRERIAEDCGISTGSVSNIKIFKDSLIGYDINSIRDFVVNVRKRNLIIQECTIGYRMQNILDMIGIDDDAQIITFLEDAYQLCTRLDLNPTEIQDSLLELIKISKDILPSEMKEHISKKRHDKEHLETQIRNLKEEVQKIEKAKSDAESKFALAKDKIHITLAEIEWFSNIKKGLEKNGIPMDDIPFLARTIDIIKKYKNNEIFETIKKINDLEGLNKEIESKKKVKAMLTTDIQNILKIDYEYSDFLSSKTILLETINEMEQMGFNIQDLRKIRNTLNEISYRNKLNPIEIKRRFFQILSRYENNIELEKEKETLEHIIFDMDKNIHKKRSIIFSQSSIGITLKNLLDKGLNEMEILKIKKFVDTTEGNNQNDPKELEGILVANPLVTEPKNMITEDKKYSMTQLNQRTFESLIWFTIEREQNNMIDNSFL